MYKNLLVLLTVFWFSNAVPALEIAPPKADKVPHVTTIHGVQLVDNYFWLRDKHWPKIEDPRILSYLTAENNYTAAILKPYQKERDDLFKELIDRIQLQDSTVPIKRDDYYYYGRTEKNSEYPIYCRKYKTLKAPEEIILDTNALAKISKYFNLGTLHVSEDNKKLLYTTDLTGAEHYTITVKDLNTGELLDGTVENTLGSVFWNKEGTGFFYAKLIDNWRSEEIYFHKLGTAQSEDLLLYKEQDPTFRVGLDQSSSKRFIFLISESSNATEVRYIDLNNIPHQTQSIYDPILIQARQEEHLYDVDHRDNLFYIRTNDKGKNFRLVTTPIPTPSQAHWQDFIPYDSNIFLTDFSLYKNHLVLSTKEHGLTQIKIFNFNIKTFDVLKFSESAYDATQIFTTFDGTGARISYSSLITPDSVLEYDFRKKELITLKVLEIPSGYNKDLYKMERIFATEKGGTQIPISLVYKKSLFKKDGTNPLYLRGYGSYGLPASDGFRDTVLSLLDRGFVFAVAHIRGGNEMGYDWYEKAKLLSKKNTFQDFISASEYLIAKKYSSKGNITISGGSAGGMLVGVCINERPELYKVAIAQVPFVDVLNTMLDETLPLTPGEFKEWGNPKDPQYFQYIKSYSPYDNIKAQHYPALYVTASINDPRVTYWEPAKWVAKLRALKTDNNLLILNLNMDAGHAGISGRFNEMQEIAKEYTFLFARYGLLTD